MLRRSRLTSWLSLTALVCLLAACKVELHANLPEEEANEIMAALLTRSIAATKIAGKDGVSVEVSETQFGEAVTILKSLGLPRADYKTVGQMFETDGIVASPLQEWAKFNFAKSQELSQTISTIQGVISANVHIAETRKEGPFQEVTPPSASVLVKMNEAFIANDLIPQIKQLVAFSIPDIEYERVGVIISPVRPPEATVQLENIGGLLVHADSAAAVRALGGATAVSTAAAAGFGAVILFQWLARRRKRLAEAQP